MSTFTKGPWLHNDFQIIADDTVIANCTYGARNSNNANDARLIAAAPVMYDFIKICAERGDKSASEILEAIHVSR